MYRSIPGPRRYRDSYGRLNVDGELWMGGYRTPPMPHRSALTDITTGEIRVLSHLEDLTEIELVEVNDRWPDVHVYGPHDGPVSNGWRLYLDGDELGFEQDLRSINQTNGLILTRRGWDRTVLQVTADTAGDMVYTPYQL